MSEAPRACPSPHPARSADGGPHASLEVIGAHGDACWTRCRLCGRWIWLETDSGRIGFRGEWEIDRELAERAIGTRRPDAVLDLLCRHGLPMGPMGEIADARLSLLRAMSGGAGDPQMLAALAGRDLDDVWLEARARLAALVAATGVRLACTPFPFSVDIHGDYSGISEVVEVRGGLLMCRTTLPHAILRVTPRGGVELPLAGEPVFLAHQEEALLLWITTGQGETLVAADVEEIRARDLLPGARPRALPLDDGHWLVFREGQGAMRETEVVDRALRRVGRLMQRFHPPFDRYPAPPRRAGCGWVASNVVLEGDDAPRALVLYDAGFHPLAATRGETGMRTVQAKGDDLFLAGHPGPPGTIEAWERRDDDLRRVFHHPGRGSTLVENTLVVVGPEGALTGLALDGNARWRVTTGLRSPGLCRLGDTVLLHADRSAVLVDPANGRTLARTTEAFPLAFAADRLGRGYLVAGPSLIRVRAGSFERTPLDGEHAIATTLEDSVVLRRAGPEGRFTVWTAEGTLRGHFEAPSTRLSVTGTRGGPYVLEPHRLRIGRM